MTNRIDSFRAAIEASGITPPDTLIDDGVLRRFPIGKRNKNGWYVLYGDGIPAGTFGNWKEGGKSEKWCSRSDTDMTQAEREAHKQRMQEAQRQRNEAKAQHQKEAQVVATERWNSAVPATEHPYLTRKGVQPFGVRVLNDNLLVPLRDTNGVIHSLQAIDTNGEKRFLEDGRVSGLYQPIGSTAPTTELVVCEGFSTGASIYIATGKPVAVAFNTGNLEAVGRALRTKYPAIQLIFGADDDWKTKGNPGITKAKEAARAVGGLVAIPNFEGIDRPEKATDMNDLHQLKGVEAVRACFDMAQAVGAAQREAAFPPLGESPFFGSGSEVDHQKLATIPNGVVLKCASDLTPSPVRWLWQYWLALGKLHILAGAPGQGKTTLAMAMAATVTIGGRWPDGSRCEPGNVLIWSGEDDPADTLLPRLMAAGADKSRCYFIDGAYKDGEVVPFDPARDMAQLVSAIQSIGGISLLIIDPVVSAVTGDSHKNTEVRRALQPLVDLASACNCALLGITHFAKGGQGTDPSQRVVGSVAFTAVARVVMVAAKVKGEDGGEDNRILARTKSNIGPDDGGFQYHLDQSEPIPGIQASLVTWGKAVEGSARELLTDPEDQVQTDSTDAGFSKKQIWTDLVKSGIKPRLTPDRTGIEIHSGQLTAQQRVSILANKAALIQRLAEADRPIDQVKKATPPPGKPPSYWVLLTTSEAWRKADQAYQAHHWNCTQCKAAGRGSYYGAFKCPTGAILHAEYVLAGEIVTAPARLNKQRNKPMSATEKLLSLK